ncbi:MAG: hypothetical protein WC655_04160 [Candidatus Hydrogenedentales bacterium]|jgi:hypothetical protein
MADDTKKPEAPTAISFTVPKGHPKHDDFKVGDMMTMTGKVVEMGDEGARCSVDTFSKAKPTPAKPAPRKKMTPREYLTRDKDGE